jgi:predicted ribosomally synthesized peptide with nif11-like leader
MSKDDLAVFLSELAQNQDLQAELRSVSVDGGDDAAVAPEELVKFAASKGHQFSVEEVRSTFELTDDELESVAGGAVFAKYDGVDGEVRDKTHKGWSDLLTFKSLTRRSWNR